MSRDRFPRRSDLTPRSHDMAKSDRTAFQVFSGSARISNFLQTVWSNQRGQDIAEYAVILAVILVLVVGTIRLVGSNANNVFSSVTSSVH
jgi:Flp pilus assembly pilin Flp